MMIKSRLENMLTELFVIFISWIMASGYVPQAVRLLKTKSSLDLSPLSFLIFAAGTTTWFIYGLAKKDWVIILSFIPGIVSSWTVLTLILLYRKKKPG